MDWLLWLGLRKTNFLIQDVKSSKYISDLMSASDLLAALSEKLFFLPLSRFQPRQTSLVYATLPSRNIKRIIGHFARGHSRLFLLLLRISCPPQLFTRKDDLKRWTRLSEKYTVVFFRMKMKNVVIRKMNYDICQTICLQVENDILRMQ